jgi:transcriptional regulator with XRE-family HTH domain
MLKIKQLRLQKNYNQNDFARLIGVSPRALSSYENGSLDITLKKIVEISEILKVNFLDLFDIPKEYFLNQADIKKDTLNEAEIYGSNNLEVVRQKTITILEREVEDLRQDKDFLKNVIVARL